MKWKVKVDMKPVNTIMTRLGVTPDGDVQKFVTNAVSGRITAYMPYRSGALTKLKFIKSPTEIEVIAPQAHYLYRGVLMVDPVTGSPWSKPEHGSKVDAVPPKALEYDKTKNPKAGPNWDKRLMAFEGAKIAADVQEYIKRRKQ